MFDLKEVAQLAVAYNRAGLGETWNARFLSNVAVQGQQPRGRGIAIMEDLMKKGPPEGWPSWQKACEYRLVARKCTVPHEAETLLSFASRIFKGNELTDKQKAYAEKLIQGATRTVVTIPITDEMRKIITGIEIVCNSRNAPYWGYRDNTLARLKRIFLNHSRLIGLFQRGIPWEEECNSISQEDYDYLCAAFPALLRDWEKAKEKVGSICKILSTGSMTGLVIGNPRVNPDGLLVVDVLVDGAVRETVWMYLRFERAPRKKKTEGV
jgi:hypothetical protein